MFIHKYKIGEDIFYRISAKRSPSGRTLEIPGEPADTAVYSGKIESIIRNLETAMKTEPEPAEEEKKQEKKAGMFLLSDHIRRTVQQISKIQEKE